MDLNQTPQMSFKSFRIMDQSLVSDCRLSSSCATESCWTSGSCRPTSPTSWRAPWSTTLATAHKCGASSATCSCTSGKNTPSCALLLGMSRGGKETLTLSILLRSVQFGAAGLQRFTAAHDRRSLGDGSWHLTDQSAVHGRSARWWGSFQMRNVLLQAAAKYILRHLKKVKKNKKTIKNSRCRCDYSNDKTSSLKRFILNLTNHSACGPRAPPWWGQIW